MDAVAEDNFFHEGDKGDTQYSASFLPVQLHDDCLQRTLQSVEVEADAFDQY